MINLHSSLAFTNIIPATSIVMLHQEPTTLFPNRVYYGYDYLGLIFLIGSRLILMHFGSNQLAKFHVAFTIPMFFASTSINIQGTWLIVFWEFLRSTQCHGGCWFGGLIPKGVVHLFQRGSMADFIPWLVFAILFDKLATIISNGRQNGRHNLRPHTFPRCTLIGVNIILNKLAILNVAGVVPVLLASSQANVSTGWAVSIREPGGLIAI
mmetsp:Transcript_7466/g.15592  ORF Transcript_7466/g.15592 Transcript_7466/m.15592 type:complete len:210 (+) Transcript_7466:1300-1929(+)